MRFLVGIDDTDSSRGGCTTYLSFRLATDLAPKVRVQPYPRLVRLNPNIPFKTRGNAAVSLTIDADDADVAFEEIVRKVEQLADVGGGANSGVVFLHDPDDANELFPLYHRALSGVVSPVTVRKLLRSMAARTFELGNGMGIVGAASALGFDGYSDHTFELISYRRRESCGTPRVVDADSVRKMDAKTFPHTFNSYDYHKRKALIAPHGPDPVFVGVRGDSPGAVAKAFSMLRFEESLEGYMIFETNQHTDAHLNTPLQWKAYSSGWMDCEVRDVTIGEGGHVYLTADAGGVSRQIAAYEPTGDLRRTATRLARGDRVRAFGGVRRPSSNHPMVLNLEKLEVLQSHHGGLPRGSYIASPRANRHLTMPLARYGRDAGGRPPMVREWLSPVPRPRPRLARSL